MRFWLVAWLALALPLVGYAHPSGVSCQMACAQGMKGCHPCCDQKPGCGFTAAKAIPAAPAKAVSASTAAPDTPLPTASVVLLHPVPPLLPPSSSQPHDLGPPRVINVQAAHCVRLL